MSTNKKTQSPADENKQNDTQPLETPDTVSTERYAGVTNFAYVGPSLPGGKLQSNTILSGRYAEILAYYSEVIAEYETVAHLIVPVTLLASVRERVQQSGTLLHNFYNDLVSAIQSKGEGE